MVRPKPNTWSLPIFFCENLERNFADQQINFINDQLSLIAKS